MPKTKGKKTSSQKASTDLLISMIFQRLDYAALGTIYCEYGGKAFWQHARNSCQNIGTKLATQLCKRLPKTGTSLYVGAGVAEIPMLVKESLKCKRMVKAYNLREKEVKILNHACRDIELIFRASDAQKAQGPFNHICMVSVLNDPECFPEVSALTYGRANPVSFNPKVFSKERQKITRLVDRCLKKLTRPGLITTSIEEIPWITDWCLQHQVPFHIEKKVYPTALVGDPICFIHIGKR